MNKKIVSGIVIAVVILAVAVVGLNQSQIDKTKNSNTTSDKSDSETQPSQPSNSQPPVTSGKYVDYSDTAIASAEGQRVLFFHAPWCSQCRSIESGIKKDGVPDGLTVIKVDYDSNQSLRQKYGVTIQTTFVKVDADGKSTGKYVAYEEPTFDSVKRNFLL